MRIKLFILLIFYTVIFSNVASAVINTYYIDSRVAGFFGSAPYTVGYTSDAPNPYTLTYVATFTNGTAQGIGWSRQYTDVIVYAGDLVTISGDYKISKAYAGLPVDFTIGVYNNSGPNVSNTVVIPLVADGTWHHYSEQVIVSTNTSMPKIKNFQALGITGYDGVISANNISIRVDSTVEKMTFATSGSTFAPIINVTGNPTILWEFEDGTTSNSATPNKNFGSSSNRINTLTVTPWSALIGVNVGYTGNDHGPDYIDILADQDVVMLNGLAFPYNLEYVAISECPIYTLNCDNCSNLTDIEAWSALSLKRVDLKNTTKLERVCFEHDNLRTLDFSQSPSLKEIRCADQDNSLIYVEWGNTSYPDLSHICLHDSIEGLNTPPYDKMPALTEVLVYNAGTVGEFHTPATNGQKIHIYNNSFTSANLSGVFSNDDGSNSLYCQNNNLTHLDVSNCRGLDDLLAYNNNLNQSEIDKIIQDIAVNNKDGGIIDLTNNSAPSYTGVLNVYDLIENGWDVYIDIPTTVVPVGTEVTVNTTTTSLTSIMSIYPAQIIPMTVISEDAINVTVNSFNGDHLIWVENSTESNAVTRHIIGGFPANVEISIYRDGNYYTEMLSNETGYIDWTYSGGYSEHTFEALVGGPSVEVRESFVSDWESTLGLVGSIIIVSLTGSLLTVLRGKKNVGEIIPDLQSVLIIITFVVLGSIIFGQF